MGHPDSVQQLIEQFCQLPCLCKKTAERLVFYLLGQPKERLTTFAQSLSGLREQIKQCHLCFNFAESDPCTICNNTKRDKTTIAVVAKPQDISVLENTNEYTGLYHVLGGTLNTLEGRTPETLKINELIRRLQASGVKEI